MSLIVLFMIHYFHHSSCHFLFLSLSGIKNARTTIVISAVSKCLNFIIIIIIIIAVIIVTIIVLIILIITIIYKFDFRFTSTLNSHKIFLFYQFFRIFLLYGRKLVLTQMNRKNMNSQLISIILMN